MLATGAVPHAGTLRTHCKPTAAPPPDLEHHQQQSKQKQKQHSNMALNITAASTIRRRYFDRTGVGYIRSEDLRRLLLSLGLGLSVRVVKDLVERVADPSGRHKGERVYYRDLVDKEVEEGAGAGAGGEGGEGAEAK